MKYTFNQVLDYGAGFLGSIDGSVTGWVMTDGTIGDIDAVNIINFDVTATINTTSYEFLDVINAGVVQSFPSGLTATPTELLFTYLPSNDFGFSAGAGTGYIVNWQSGSGGLIVAQLGYGNVGETGGFYGQTLPIAYVYHAPAPIAGDISWLTILVVIVGGTMMGKKKKLFPST